MNAQGLFDVEFAYKRAELVKEGNEQRLINGRKLADICSKGYFSGINMWVSTSSKALTVLRGQHKVS